MPQDSQIDRGPGNEPRSDGIAPAPTDFGAIYEEHIWRVYGFLAYRVGDTPTAEDLTQITFERALRAWSRFDPRRGSVGSWLLTIARNALIDHVRRDRSASLAPIDEQQLPTVPGPETSADGSSELLACLDQLSEREREVIALRFGGDLSGAEVALMLGMSVANVHQLLSRSLRKLRELLEQAQLAQPLVTRQPRL
jgi:RNA polymerase sigma factor (sigma-70 family)